MYPTSFKPGQLPRAAYLLTLSEQFHQNPSASIKAAHPSQYSPFIARPVNQLFTCVRFTHIQCLCTSVLDAEELAHIMRRLGRKPSDEELGEALGARAAGGGDLELDFPAFVQLVSVLASIYQPQLNTLMTAYDCIH